MRRFNEWRKQWRYPIYLGFVGAVFVLFLLWRVGVTLPKPLDSTTVIALMMVYLLVEIAENTLPRRSVMFFPKQTQAEEALISWIKENKVRVKKATLIQYSSHKVEDLLRVLLKVAKARVTIYIQSPKAVESLRSERQAELIRHGVHEIENDVDLRPYFQSGKLTVRYYDVPPAVRAVKLDDKAIVVGWYVWYHAFDPEAVLGDNEKETDQLRKRIEAEDDFKRTAKYNDEKNLFGHNQPGMLAYNGTAEYEILRDLVEKLVENFEIHNTVRTMNEAATKKAQIVFASAMQTGGQTVATPAANSGESNSEQDAQVIQPMI